MASRTIVELVDDLDGSEADETVSFALDGQPYEIDLTAEHAEQLRTLLQEWVENARSVAGRAGERPRRRPSSWQDDRAVIRQWARDHGYSVSSRGRIAQRIVDAYGAAGGR